MKPYLGSTGASNIVANSNIVTLRPEALRELLWITLLRVSTLCGFRALHLIGAVEQGVRYPVIRFNG